MDLTIARSEGIVAIDNQPLAVDTSSLAVNIAIVAYDCTAGSGKIEYSDGLRLLNPFIDVTPYVSFVNAWLTQAALITGTASLTLALAQQIKLALVDGIFNSKRQLPITTLNNTWDASDQALMGMQAAITSWDVAASATAADTALTQGFNSLGINTARASDINASPPAGAGGGAISYLPGITISYDSKGNITSFTNLGAQNSPAWMGSVSGGGFSSQANFTASYNATLAAPTITGPRIDWPPLNSTVTVSLAMSDMQSLISSINSRRTNLQNTRLTKRNEINARLNVAAVIAYDVTTGWPF